jgi:hypothetical protein
LRRRDWLTRRFKLSASQRNATIVMKRMIDTGKVYRARKARTRNLIADVFSCASVLPHDFQLRGDWAQEERDRRFCCRCAVGSPDRMSRRQH